MYSLLLALIYLAFISLGLPDSLLGSGWPAMHGELGVPVSYMGIVTMVISACTILSSLLSDRLTRACGTPAVTIVSVLLTAGALLGFSFANAFWQLLLLALPYGLGAGRHRRGAQQLRRPALQGQAHELAAQLLGGWAPSSAPL